MRPREIAILSLSLALSAALLFGAAATAEQPLPGLIAPRWLAQRFVAERTAVGLAWTTVPGAVRYAVLRRAAKEVEFRQIATTPGLQFVDTAVERGVVYRYAIRAEGPGGAGPASAEAEVLALEPELAPPASPRLTDLESETTGAAPRVRLLWTPVSGAISYNVHRRDTQVSGGDFRLLASVDDAHYTDVDVVAGGKYEYRVSAVSQALVEGLRSDPRVVALPVSAAPAAVRQSAQALRVRRSREALVLRADERLPIKAPVDLVASADGTVFVLDNQLPGVLVFAPGGEFQRVIGGPDAGGVSQLRRPYGIALDAQGTVWVTDHRERSEIVAFDPRSGRVTETVVFDAPPRPEALERLTPRARGERPFALDLDFLPGGEMVVTDNTFGRVCFLGRGGAPAREFGLPGDKAGEFNRPSKIMVDPEGRIFVLDAQNKRVQVFSGDGAFLYEIGRSPTMVGSFVGLSGVAWDAEGSVFVADSPMATVQAFDRRDGSYRYHVGGEAGAVDDAGTRPRWDVVTPAGLALEPKTGRLWIGMPMAHALAVRELLPLGRQASP